MILKYLNHQIEEIQNSKVLRIYGLFLVAVHFLTFYFWNHSIAYDFYLSESAGSLCWSFLDQCTSWRFPNSTTAMVALYSYLALAIVTFVGMIRGHLRLGYFGLLALYLIKYGLLLIDYRLMGNYHYMPFIIGAVFLFFPRKEIFIKVLIATFYCAAGLLKLRNLEWMTGGAIYDVETWPSWLVVIACSAVIYLEVALSWFLLGRRHWFTWAVFACFILFHASSWYWVGYYYPLTMSCLLPIFPLSWILEERQAQSVTPQQRTHWALVTAVLAFWVAQFYPLLLSRDAAVTGEGRVLSLNMYDARVECDHVILAEYKDRYEEFGSEGDAGALRIRCEPYIYFSRAKAACDSLKADPDFKNIRLSLMVRRQTDSEFKEIVNIKDFCTGNYQFNSLGRNEWIRW
jgi:hypothetical protein